MPLPQLESLARPVRRRVQRRGDLYFEQGRVAIVRADDDAIEAEVLGSRVYAVRLRRKGSVLFVACDCPYSRRESDFCKHVWATIRAAQAGDLLPHADRLWMEPHLPDSKDPADLEPFDAFLPSSSYTSHPFDEFDEFDAVDDDPDDAAPEWRSLLERVRRSRRLGFADPADPRGATGPAWAERGTDPARRPRLAYLVDVEASARRGALELDLLPLAVDEDGGWRRIPVEGDAPPDLRRFADAADRLALAVLRGTEPASTVGDAAAPVDGALRGGGRVRLAARAAAVALPALCRTGRCATSLPEAGGALHPLTWEEEPWSFALRLRAAPGGYALEGLLRRDREERTLDAATALLPGVALFEDRAAPVLEGGALDRFADLHRAASLAIPEEDVPELLDGLLADPAHPPLDLPEELGLTEERVAPRPVLRIRVPSDAAAELPCTPAFDYDGREVDATDPRAELLDLDLSAPDGARRILPRDPQAEVAHRSRLLATGFRGPTRGPGAAGWRIPLQEMQRAATELVQEGWLVEAAGKLVRDAVRTTASVSSGIDWFEVDARVDFGAQTANLERLLEARRRGKRWVRLGDGSSGILPEEWLEALAGLEDLGELRDGVLRFRRSQMGLVDALLAARDAEVERDAAFVRSCRELAAFDGIRPEDPPPGFHGLLRPYQREALGWFRFLERFGFGGCLADDMGLGKTVQVLAWLAQSACADPQSPSGQGDSGSRSADADSGPRSADADSGAPSANADPDDDHAPRTSLVVAPRSLVHNWLEEAARFVPHLRAREHGGPGRPRTPDAFVESLADCDLMVTTYGTLQRDAETFAAARFDLVVLDEAQAIKNPRTKASRAARLLQARRRLALSGTPIENHLGELWSLFDFLNPGMLGSDARFRKAARKQSPSDPGSLDWIGRAIRPFVLRRTKAQVARELPERTEQTLHCDLSPRERKLYAGLAEYYRDSVLGEMQAAGEEGLGRKGTRILEALLRLRQAACHGGLIDPKRRKEGSAKLDLLLPRLQEIADEGGKALVFSQFTALLALVRERLDAGGGPAYAYLDGATRDRAAVVRRFQREPDCPLFLISLKAGGLGLNLTAADAVFLLDPWWNPAVEAQAIDRAHRIGRRKPVFAYRLVSRGTVEEKILELQERKRDLADSILRADRGPLASMTLADLELLLSV